MATAESVDHVQRGRLLVQEVYSEKGGPVGSVMGMWAGKGKDQKESSLKPSKSSIGISATRVHAAETRPTGSSKPPRSVRYSSANTIRAINTLPPKEQLWVAYVYNPSRRSKLGAVDMLFFRVWLDYRNTYLGNARRTTHRAVESLLKLQLSHCSSYHDYLIWDADRPREVKDMGFNDGQSITREQWRRKYEFHWRNIRQNLEEIDRSAMRRVSEIA